MKIGIYYDNKRFTRHFTAIIIKQTIVKVRENDDNNNKVDESCLEYEMK